VLRIQPRRHTGTNRKPQYFFPSNHGGDQMGVQAAAKTAALTAVTEENDNSNFMNFNILFTIYSEFHELQKLKLSY